jgi:Tol biopolymer transport system component/DNA-binding winged helix-turn-helix (wHTH) protein
MRSTDRKVYLFDEFRLDVERRMFWRGSSTIQVNTKVFDLLTVFVAKPMQVLEREFLLRQIWSDRHVDEANLNVSISTLRKLLGDSAAASKFIETIPTKGYRFVADVREQVLSPDTPPDETGSNKDEHSGSSSPAIRPQRINATVLLAAMAVLLAIACAMAMVRLHTRPPASGSLLNHANIRPITNSEGHFSQPAFSRDGKSVAYAWNKNQSDSRSIYIQDLDKDVPVAVTAANGLDFAPSWSPIGGRIAYLHCRNLSEPMQLLVVNLTGEKRPQEIVQIAPFLSTNASPAGPPTLDWSSDTKLFVTSDIRPGKSSRSLVLISADSGSKRFLTDAPSYGDDAFGRFSPDGSQIAFRRKFAASSEDVFIVNPSTGAERRITWDHKTVCGLSWSEDAQSLIVCSLRGGGYGNLWRFYLGNKPPEHLTTARFGAQTPTVAPTGDRLAYVSQVVDDNLWRVSTEANHKAEKFIASTFLDSSAHYSPDGKLIAFRSDRTGNNEIWICDAEGDAPRRLTDFHGPMVGSPRWAPDGASIAFDSRAAGTSDIYTVDVKSRVVTRVTFADSDEEVPNWSHDGKWIYYSSNRSGRFEIWKTPRTGGDGIPVTHEGAFNGVESADGHFLYYVHDLAATDVMRLNLSDGKSTNIIPALGSGMWAYWTLAGDDVYFLRRSGGHRAAIYRFEGATNRTVTLGSADYTPAVDDKGLDISPNRKWLLFTQREYDRGAIMLAEDFR